MRAFCKNIGILAVTSGLSLFSALSAQAQTNLAYWNFNDAAIGTTGATSQSQLQGELFSPDGGANASTASMSTNFTTAEPTSAGFGGSSITGINSFTGTTVNALNSDSAGQSLALQSGTSAISGQAVNNGDYLQFSVRTSGYQGILVSFATQRTNTGFNSDQFAYSTDGINFTSFGAAYTMATSFALQSFDLTSVTALNNASTAYFRIFFNGATTTNNNGNNRIDNLQINGTAIVTSGAAAPEPGSLGFLLIGAIPVFGVATARRRRTKTAWIPLQ